MAIKKQTVLEVAKGLKAFLKLEVGLTRGQLPDLDPQYETRLQRLSQDLEKSRSQVRKKDQQISRLKKDLAKEREKAEKRLGSIHYGGTLPPKGLRMGRASLRSDEVYLTSARKIAGELVENLGLTQDSRLLDVGCGPGRLAIGILDSVGDISKYRGVDVNKDCIQWAQSNITSEHPNFQFVHVDARNARYNPAGEEIKDSFRLPFTDGEFDHLCLYSVFTHMLADDVRVYLRDFYRLLSPGGNMFLTAFVEEGVPDVTENPEDYVGQRQKGPLHRVRYNKDFFEKLLEDSGFRLDRFSPERDVAAGLTCVKQ